MVSIFAKLVKLIQIPEIRDSKLDKSVWIGSGSQIYRSSAQYGTYMGNDVQCLFADIGKYCSIANNCIIGGAEHPIAYVSTSPVFYGGYSRPIKRMHIKKGDLVWNSYSKRTIIKNDVWIGNNVIIKAGVTIGDGAIIGAGAVVVKDIPPYEIWGGNPAKLIRKRFSEEIIQQLLDLEWWNLPDSVLQDNSIYMDEPEKFIEKVKQYRKLQ